MNEDIEINPSDLAIDSYSSEHRSGFSTKPLNGVRITHLPTGVQVTCENERSQHKNRAIAIDMLREKLKNLKVHPKSNPILLGQAEVFDIIPENVQKMIAKEGMYLCGDSKYPEATVPIVSMAGKLYSMVIDTEMAPDRFLDTLTVSGPFTKDACSAPCGKKLKGIERP